MLENKSQILNSKSQINPKSRILPLQQLSEQERDPALNITRGGKNPRTKQFWPLVILLSVIVWNLVLGIWNFSSFAQEQFVYNAKGKRNPFIPLVSPDGRLIKVSAQDAKGDLSLEGIIYDENGVSYCLISGAPSKIGDIVGEGYQVLKIEQKKVIFIKDGELTEVLLKEGESEK